MFNRFGKAGGSQSIKQNLEIGRPGRWLPLSDEVQGKRRHFQTEHVQGAGSFVEPPEMTQCGGKRETLDP